MRAALFISFLLCTAARAGWTEGAWPACEHVGGREFSPGVLYKQIWARDIFRALEERCQAVAETGNTNLWSRGGSGYRPAWWTEEGVTNRVVRYDGPRYDGGQFEGDNDVGGVLPAAKWLAANLSAYFFDPEVLDPEGLPGSWNDLQVLGGGRTNIPVLSETFTEWVWGCPGVSHSEPFTVYEVESRGTHPYHFNFTNIAARCQLPRDYLSLTPARLLEGLCNPAAAATGAMWEFKVGAVTGVCNFATLGTVTATNGAAAAAWSFAVGCIAAQTYPGLEAYPTQPTFRSFILSNGGSTTATHVRVTVTLDSHIELVQASALNNGNSIQWADWPVNQVRAYAGQILPGQWAAFTIWVRVRGTQGTSPHAGGKWYWSDFGWDGLRTVLGKMNHQRNPGAVYADWAWDEEEGDNNGQANGSSEKWWYKPESGPDELVTDGDFGEAVAEAESDFNTWSGHPHDPEYCYSHLFGASTDFEPGESYGCGWYVKFFGRKAHPKMNASWPWPPAGVTAEVRYFCDVETWEAPSGQAVWSTEELAGATFSAPTTNDTIFATVIGHNTPQPGLRPGDPSSSKGLPRYLGLAYPDVDNYYDPDAGSYRGNMYRESKHWDDPFLTVEYTWSYP